MSSSKQDVNISLNYIINILDYFNYIDYFPLVKKLKNKKNIQNKKLIFYIDKCNEYMNDKFFKYGNTKPTNITDFRLYDNMSRNPIFNNPIYYFFTYNSNKSIPFYSFGNEFKDIMTNKFRENKFDTKGDVYDFLLGKYKIQGRPAIYTCSIKKNIENIIILNNHDINKRNNYNNRINKNNNNHKNNIVRICDIIVLLKLNIPDKYINIRGIYNYLVKYYIRHNLDYMVIYNLFNELNELNHNNMLNGWIWYENYIGDGLELFILNPINFISINSVEIINSIKDSNNRKISNIKELLKNENKSNIYYELRVKIKFMNMYKFMGDNNTELLVNNNKNKNKELPNNLYWVWGNIIYIDDKRYIMSGDLKLDDLQEINNLQQIPKKNNVLKNNLQQIPKKTMSYMDYIRSIFRKKRKNKE
jgi:hypothetical protein